MTSRVLPGIGLNGFWDLGENGWKDENDWNLLVLSVLAGGQVLDLVAALPGSPTNGQVYLLDETAGADANKLAIRDAGAWVLLAPLEGAILYDVAAGLHRTFDGTVWAELTTGGGGPTVENDPTLASDSTANAPSVHAVRGYVATAVTGLLDYKGTIDCSANPNYPAASKGDTYKVSVAGKVGGASGVSVDAGDWVVANTDNAGGTQASVGSNWDTLEHNGAFGAATYTPSVQSVTSSATVTPTFSDDAVKITAQAAGLTLANWSGTAIPMWGMAIRIKDNGTVRAISYGSKYRAIGVTLPTTTVISKTLYLGCIYNADDDKIDVVAVAQEA